MARRFFHGGGKTDFTVETSGFKELDLALGDLVQDIGVGRGRTILRKSMQDALWPIAEGAASRAPFDKGFLAESQTVGGVLTKAQKAKLQDKSEIEVYAGPGPSGYPEAIMQEFGTFSQPPQPSLTPAWEAGKVRVLADMKTSLGANIIRGAKAAARRRMKGRR